MHFKWISKYVPGTCLSHKSYPWQRSPEKQPWSALLTSLRPLATLLCRSAEFKNLIHRFTQRDSWCWRCKTLPLSPFYSPLTQPAPWGCPPCPRSCRTEPGSPRSSWGCQWSRRGRIRGCRPRTGWGRCCTRPGPPCPPRTTRTPDFGPSASCWTCSLSWGHRSPQTGPKWTKVSSPIQPTVYNLVISRRWDMIWYLLRRQTDTTHPTSLQLHLDKLNG